MSRLCHLPHSLTNKPFLLSQCHSEVSSSLHCLVYGLLICIFNSCRFCGCCVQICAVCSIKTGEEICICYGTTNVIILLWTLLCRSCQSSQRSTTWSDEQTTAKSRVKETVVLWLPVPNLLKVIRYVVDEKVNATLSFIFLCYLYLLICLFPVVFYL